MARERAEPLWVCRFAVCLVCCRVRVANLTVNMERATRPRSCGGRGRRVHERCGLLAILFAPTCAFSATWGMQTRSQDCLRWLSLPEELLLHVLRGLKSRHIVRFLGTCRQLHVRLAEMIHAVMALYASTMLQPGLRWQVEFDILLEKERSGVRAIDLLPKSLLVEIGRSLKTLGAVLLPIGRSSATFSTIHIDDWMLEAGKLRTVAYDAGVEEPYPNFDTKSTLKSSFLSHPTVIDAFKNASLPK